MRAARRAAWLAVFSMACGGGGGSGDATPPLVPTAPGSGTTVPAVIGLNLSAVSYYASQAPFADVFRNRDAWVATDGDTWDTERLDEIPTDADGYPLSLPVAGQMVQAGVFLPFKGESFEI